jgi:phage baseplate assembly protein W
VNQSLKNLIFTNVGERLFQPTVGSNVWATLFELNTQPNLSTLEFYIQNTIKNYEPRVNPLKIEAISVDDHQIQVNIVYSLINNPALVSFSFLLKRAR